MKRVAALAAVLALAGCGGASTQPTVRQPHLPRALASAWRAQSNGVAAALAAGDGCLALQRAHALESAVIAHVNEVPRRFQEPLTSAVNELVAQITCTPPAPTPVPAKPRPHPHPPHPPHHPKPPGPGKKPKP